MANQKLGRIQWGPLSFGPGSRYHVTTIAGLDDLPDIRADDMPRPEQHGDYTGPDTTGPRTVQLGLTLIADSPDELRDLTLALRAATQPQRQPEPLLFLDQGTLVYGKVRRRALPYDAEHLWRTGTAALELYCADPYLYGLDEQMASTSAYSPAAGRTYPLSYTGVVPGTNYVLNPSVEVDLSNTSSYNAVTRARITSDARFGTACVQCTQTSASNFSGNLWAVAPITGTGTTVHVGVWVKLPATGITSTFFAWRGGGVTHNTTSLGSGVPRGSWQWVTSSYTLLAGQTVDQVGIACVADVGAVWLTDACIANTTAPPTYGDGTMTGYGWAWTGTPHASTSVRTITGTGRTYGDAGESGRITAINAGAADAYPVLRIDGPVSNPSVEQVTTGQSLIIDATLGDGEYLTIDTRTRAVLYMGSSPRRSWIRAGSTWPTLRPGTNEIAYRGGPVSGGSGTPSLLTVTWRDTSL